MIKKTSLFYLYFNLLSTVVSLFFPWKNVVFESSINSFKASQNFFSCSSLVNTFKKDNISFIIVTHGIIDCEEKNSQNTKQFDSSLVLINLTPSLQQYQIVVAKIIKYYQSDTFSIIHSDSNYYKNFGINLIFRLNNFNNFRLGFFLSANDQNINKMMKPKINLIFAFLECGENLNLNEEFMNKLYLYHIKLIIAFDSIQCLKLFNQLKIKSKNIFKLLASDELEINDFSLHFDDFKKKHKKTRVLSLWISPVMLLSFSSQFGDQVIFSTGHLKCDQ